MPERKARLPQVWPLGFLVLMKTITLKPWLQIRITWDT